MKFPKRKSQDAFTLIEAAVASMVIAIFLGSMFTLNSACLSLVRNAKDSAAAMLSNQERVEQLRSCNWSQITDRFYIRDTVMSQATQTGQALSNATEIVRITEQGFLPANTTPAMFEVTRTPNGASFSGANDNRNTIDSRMLKIDITVNWHALGGRSRSRSSTSVIAKGGLTINETTTIAPSVNW